jgi:periplasmic divalent cation tolerance protein
MDDEVCEIIITAPDAAWLADFTRHLVDARLAASGHNIAPIRSIYRWQGRSTTTPRPASPSTPRTSLVPSIIDETNRRHPYEVPCVIALPIIHGSPAYVQWILDSTIVPAA